MTTYNKKYEYVRWNELDEKSVKKAEIKKTKLENQGYSLINTIGGLFQGIYFRIQKIIHETRSTINGPCLGSRVERAY
jgi:hypothetical protein